MLKIFIRQIKHKKKNSDYFKSVDTFLLINLNKATFRNNTGKDVRRCCTKSTCLNTDATAIEQAM